MLRRLTVLGTTVLGTTVLGTTVLGVAAAIAVASGAVFAQGRVTPHGRSTIEFINGGTRAVASYDYSQANHSGAWLLLDFAVQTRPPTVYRREQFSLLTPDERRIPLASHDQVVSERPALTTLFQNATAVRRPLGAYFTSPLTRSIQFYSLSSTTIQNTFVTQADDVAAGELLFRAPDGTWAPGTYRLVVDHDKARVELPIELK